NMRSPAALDRPRLVGRRAWLPAIAHHVDGYDTPWLALQHVHGDAFQDSAINEKAAAVVERRDEPGDAHARADPLEHRTRSMHHDFGRDQVTADGEAVNVQLLEPCFSEDPLEHRLCLPGSQECHARKGVVLEWVS